MNELKMWVVIQTPKAQHRQGLVTAVSVIRAASKAAALRQFAAFNDKLFCKPYAVQLVIGDVYRI